MAHRLLAEVDSSKALNSGVWDSIHVFAVEKSNKGGYDYRLTTTVMVRFRSF